MKKERVNKILLEQQRKNKIRKYMFSILIMLICTFSLFFLYYSKTRNYYVSYKETSDLDYKVYLKENEFFETPYLGKNDQYIANVIDYIKADFSYKIDIEDRNINYQYQYYVEAFVNVLDNSTRNTLLSKKFNLVDKRTSYSHGKSFVEIKESIDIDYNYYNDLIRKFINVYDLSETTSTLEINMYVKVLGNCEDIEDAEMNNVISLSIPLTTKTIAIDMNYNILGDSTDVMICNDTDSIAVVYLISAFVFLTISIVLMIMAVKFNIKSRTAESIYHKELRKILSSYKSYIQKINNEFNLTGYKLLKVDSFTDMLEIRDTIQEPILMVENENHTGVYFIIPSKTKILYTYSIKVADIKSKMKKNSK